MISLSLRASFSVVAATWFVLGPGPTLSAQSTDCTSTTCAPVTGCANCPSPAPLTFATVIPPRDLGARFNNITIPTFPDSGPGSAGALLRAELKFTISPEQIRFRVENLAQTTANVTSPTYDVGGYIDVLDPLFPPVQNVALVRTSDKVEGFLNSTNCLKWRVNGNLTAQFSGTIPPFDNCYDFNDPGQTPLPVPPGGMPSPCLGSPHGGPCDLQPLETLPGTCCPDLLLHPLLGRRIKMGRGVTSDGTCPDLGFPDSQRSGFTDTRNFNGFTGTLPYVSTGADDYIFTICFTDAAHLNYLKLSNSGAIANIPLKTEPNTIFPGIQSSNIDVEELVHIGIKVEAKYFYCPTAPVCAPDTGNVCRSIGSMTPINVLFNDTPPPGIPPVGGLRCTALTGTMNLTQGTYGSAQWVDDPACVNTACNLRCIKYTLTSLPPVGTTTDTFSYTIVGNNDCTSTCTVTVTIASPICDPDTGDVCRAVGSMTNVNVFDGDTSLRPINCAALTGTTGLTQGTYGSTAWVTDASFTGGLCPTKGVKYTLTTLPPAGVTTDTFSYTVADTLGCTSTCTVTITIASPVCDPDTGDVCRTVGSMTNVNVFDGDTSLRPINCARLIGVTGLTQGTFGTTAWVTDPTFTGGLCPTKGVKYTLTSLPPVGTTTDSFTYTIADTLGCTSTCTVTITIASPVCAPVTANLCRTVGSTTDVNVLATATSLRPLNCGLLSGATGIVNGSFVRAQWVNGTCVNTLCAGKCLRLTLNALPPVGTTSDVVSYTLTDSAGCVTTCSVTVTIASPVCDNDTGDVCRTIGAMTNVNVFDGDTSLRPINCAALTGTTGLTQGAFGSTAWVTDAAFTGGLCPTKGVKYTLTSLPPVGTTTDSFSYTITDTAGCPSTCTVTITIASPVCDNDTGDVCRAVGAMTNVNVFDGDTSLRPINCAILTGTTGLTQGAFGSTAWVTDAAFTGGLCPTKGVKYTLTSLPPVGTTTDSFTYTITDSAGCPSTCTVTITVASPVCDPDTGNVCRVIGSMTNINVFDGDTSLRPINCARLSGTTGLTQGAFGTTTWVTDASFTGGLCPTKGVKYTLTSLPPVGTTTDSFTYTIADTNGCSSTCTVTVTIASPVCDPDTGNVCRVIGSMTNVNVFDGDTSLRPINCAILTGTTGLTQGTYGNAAWVTDATFTGGLCPTKGVKYTLSSLPPVGTTTDSFSYTITDTAGCTSTCTVTITIASPVCDNDTGDVCRTVGSMTNVNVFDGDTSLRPINCALLTGATGLTQGAFGSTAWVTEATFVGGLCPTKGVKYTLTSLPPAGTTTDSFSYTITDTAGCTSTCTVTITIASPVCDNDTGDVCRAIGSMTNVNVLDGDTSLRPINCASLTGTTGLTQGAFGSTVWVTDATFLGGLCPTKGVKYTLTSLPPAGTTSDSFTYTITDTAGCPSTCTVTIKIESPVCVGDCVDVCGSIGSMATINVLANDTSFRPLNCGLLTGVASAANCLSNGTYGTTEWVNGSCPNALCTGKCVKYTVTALPPVGVTMDSFTYCITDTFGCTSTCTVQVRFCRIDAVDDGPVMGCAPYPVRVCVLDNDTSTCGILGCGNLSIVSQPPNGIVQIMQSCGGLPTDCCHTSASTCTGCCLVYTPNPGFSGMETFTYRISTTSASCGGTAPAITCSDTATVTILIKPSPIANDDTYPLNMSGVAGPFNVRENDSPGTGCEFAGCITPCQYQGCPTIVQPPAFGTVVIGADCRFTYTANPGVPFPGADSFTYCIQNNCGCCDDARVTITNCPMINRQQPGSLLIYPEFDNRPGRTTYVTITNSSCKWPNAGTWVEFIYINKETCIETNRTTFLTACDTYTVVTSAHNPNPVRGFMYAFAKDALGHPISFNYLIGDLLILDGVDGFQYAVNPVTFRSPLARGAFTDLDNDGIRDLNDLEYEGAPDMLLIPRFLGQDPPGEGVVQDELVVLGLSGGLSFQTVLSFIGYNDNEIPFSVTKQFYCWEKWKLSDISGAFLNSYLKGLGDDPLEIIGMTTREAGWFKIDGLSAFSDAETILDPAFYAFLVERQTTDDRAAELPFEICAQGNGDLQPKNPLGDGPNPVAGDNQ